MPDDGEDQDKPSNGFAKRFKESYKKVGSSKGKRCSDCNTEIPPDTRTCPKCGATVLTDKKGTKARGPMDFDIILDELTSVDEDLTKLEVSILKDRRDRRRRGDYERDMLISEPLARDRLSVIKERMAKKGKEGPAPDIMGLLMTDKVKAARSKDLKVDEEELKARFVKGIESVAERSSLLEHLGDAFTSSTDAIDRTMV